MRRLIPAAAVLANCFLVGCIAVLTDALLRPTFGPAGAARHAAAAMLLYAVCATVFGALCVASATVIWRVQSFRGARWAVAGVALLAAAAAALAVLPVATFTLATDRLQGGWAARFGPWLVAGVAGLGAALTALWVTAAARLAYAGRRLLPLTTVVVFGATAVATVYVDQTMYVSLYARLHSTLEAFAALALGVSLAPLTAWSLRRFGRPTAVVALALSAICVLSGAAYVSSSAVRGWASASLRHAWRKPVLVGRMLARAQFVESYLRNPGAWTDETLTGVALLRQRYDLGSTTRDSRWDAPMGEPPRVLERLEALRQGKTYNVVVYYVDTLRADVASDPKLMPEVCRFSERALSFDRTYSTGSDTLHALPGLTGGSFDLYDGQPNDLLVVARRAGFRTSLVAAQSAKEFLGKLLPRFAFDETVEVVDYVRGNTKVWGYGADQPTARRIVDEALQWIAQHRDRPFLTWLFNFDVHAWRELDEAYVAGAAKTFGIVDDATALAWRYRVVARALDAEFGRFVRGLDAAGLRDDTIVVFVSDHGEGLGRDGFWVHSVFLWEPLVRVPLRLRIPGLAPRHVDAPVSLVDVAPTLARFMVPGADTQGYQGVDLLSYLLDERPPRRTPLILAGTSKEKLVRLGIIDPADHFKLVVPLEAAVPELYDLGAPDPDGEDVASRYPEVTLRLLNDLVQAPLFPRPREEEALEEPVRARP